MIPQRRDRTMDGADGATTQQKFNGSNAVWFKIKFFNYSIDFVFHHGIQAKLLRYQTRRQYQFKPNITSFIIR
jgi:hypothetical protein